MLLEFGPGSAGINLGQPDACTVREQQPDMLVLCCLRILLFRLILDGVDVHHNLKSAGDRLLLNKVKP